MLTDHVLLQHPMAVPNPEQTASLFSFLTYIWLDPTIWRAYRLPHLPVDELPPLCDYDEMRHLIKRSYPVGLYVVTAHVPIFSHISFRTWILSRVPRTTGCFGV